MLYSYNYYGQDFNLVLYSFNDSGEQTRYVISNEELLIRHFSEVIYLHLSHYEKIVYFMDIDNLFMINYENKTIITQIYFQEYVTQFSFFKNNPSQFFISCSNRTYEQVTILFTNHDVLILDFHFGDGHLLSSSGYFYSNCLNKSEVARSKADSKNIAIYFYDTKTETTKLRILRLNSVSTFSLSGFILDLNGNEYVRTIEMNSSYFGSTGLIILNKFFGEIHLMEVAFHPFLKLQENSFEQNQEVIFLNCSNDFSSTSFEIQFDIIFDPGDARKVATITLISIIGILIIAFIIWLLVRRWKLRAQYRESIGIIEEDTISSIQPNGDIEFMDQKFLLNNLESLYFK